MIRTGEPWDTAQLLLETYGERAAFHAARIAGELRAEGDAVGAARMAEVCCVVTKFLLTGDENSANDA